EGLIMTAGGFNGKMFISSAESYLPAAQKWREEPSMKVARGHSASCMFKGKMWVLGGWNPYESTGAETMDSRALQSIEIFDTMRNIWINGPDMISRRAFHKSVALNGNIFVLGGFDGHKDLDLVDRLDIEKELWVRGSSFRTPRSALSAGVIRNRIFILGGQNGLDTFCTVESMDPREGKWQQEPDMLYHRANGAGLALVGDSLYALGGFDGAA
ncbi:hypothetical protein GUITHDRAFT_57278, partial [Guillardia theta CCMP2712]